MSQCRLYLITPPALPDPDRFAAEALEPALQAGDVACLQLRLKDVDDGAVERAARALMPVAHAQDVALLINDRPDIAAAVGADGVHVGQEDASYDVARAAVGSDAIVGVTCHDSRDLAFRAADAGADYVAFGAFFLTRTKEAPTRASVDLLEGWSQFATTPCVAIGGITAENGGDLVRAGADFLAVSSFVWDHGDGPAEAVARMNRAIAEAGS